MMDETNRELLQQRTKELQTLVRVAQLINIIDLDYVLIQTMQLVTEVSGADKGSFFLIDSAKQPIQRFLTQRDMPPEVSKLVAREVIQKGLAGWSIEHQQSALAQDVLQDERWLVFSDDTQDDVRSALCVPVINTEKKIQGIITLVSSKVAHFGEHELQLVEAIANQASTAIRNAQLFDDLQTKQRQLELVLNNNSEVLLTIDDRHCITLINPEAQNLLANPKESVIGRKLDELENNSVYLQVAQRLRQAPAGTHSLSFELRDETKKRDFVVNISALRQSTEDFIQGYVITLHDVTSIREFERLKTTMLHMLTHDLKNPLNVIWGYVDLLRVDSQSNEPADSRFIDGILRALQRMDILIQDTLNTERLMAAGEKQPQHAFSPNQIIKEALDTVSHLGEQKSHQIINEVQPQLAKIMGTPFQLREAVVNLISNAIKYTPPDGTIWIHASNDQDRFQFYVKDTGLGIPEDLQHQIFTKFYRAQRAETAEIEGTGIGLSLVKSAVESHMGQVWFESQAGQGSTFGFWIPLYWED